MSHRCESGNDASLEFSFFNLKQVKTTDIERIEDI